MPVEHRRDSSGTLLFVTDLLQKEKVLFPAILTKNPRSVLIYNEATDGILAETQLLHTKTATVNRERPVKLESMRTGEAVHAIQSTARQRLQEAERC